VAGVQEEVQVQEEALEGEVSEAEVQKHKMVVIILPQWTSELEEKLDKVIKDIAIKNKIDMIAVDDSKSIDTGKRFISNTLVRIFENYGVEERKRLEKFEEDMKKDLKEMKEAEKNGNTKRNI
jgi:DNA polymerase III alpha subunit